jgi:heptosyltransferase III
LLVLRPGALGDALLAVPALRALRSISPGAQLTLAAHGGAARLLAALGEVDAGRSFDDPGLAWLWTGHVDERVDVGMPDAIVGWLSDDGHLGQRLATLGVGDVLLAPSRPTTDAPAHVARYLCHTLRPLTPRLPDFDVRPLAVASAGRGDVLLHPGSGSARKNWPPESFAGVASTLLAQGAPVRLIVGEADEGAAAMVEHVLGQSLPRLAQPWLIDLAAALAGSVAYLGNDSGVSHLAGLVGARAFVLFGPTDPRRWRPLGPRVTVLPFDAAPAAVASSLRSRMR